MTLKRCPILMRGVGYQDSETNKRCTLPYQQFLIGYPHNRCYLQIALADLAVLQVDEAEPENQEIYGV